MSPASQAASDGSDDAPRLLCLLAADGERTRAAEDVEQDVRIRGQPLAGGGRAQLDRVGGDAGEAEHDVVGAVDADLELASAAEAQQDDLAPIGERLSGPQHERRAGPARVSSSSATSAKVSVQRAGSTPSSSA